MLEFSKFLINEISYKDNLPLKFYNCYCTYIYIFDTFLYISSYNIICSKYTCSVTSNNNQSLDQYNHKCNVNQK